MQTRRAHRILGLVLVLPLFGWAATGFVFFLKPGYEAAYQTLGVRQYPIENGTPAPLPPDCLDLRVLRTILGEHVLLRTSSDSKHLDAQTLRPRALPEEADLRRLLDDAISSHRERYGKIASLERNEVAATASARTTTGVRIELDWTTLSLRQTGRDTVWIDRLYRIHYLQWTGVAFLDRALGLVGLVSLVILAALGLRLALDTRQ